MLKTVRRIVTTNNSDGQSSILSDESTPHSLETAPSRGLIDLWAMFAGGPDTTTKDGADRPIVLAPAAGGNTFRFFQLPPSVSDPLNHDHSASIFARMGGTNAHVKNEKHPNMHRTESIDYIVLLQGHVKLILDEGETILNPLDVVIQRETNHAWQNLSTTEPALLLAVLVDTSAWK
jgi:hypothetical protein